MAFLANATFENGQAGWVPINGANFTVGADWSLIVCALDGTDYQYLRQKNQYAHPTIRVEFYVGTPGVFLDIDTVIVC